MGRMPDDVQGTARAFFLLKLAGGEVPETWKGGRMDGVLYFRLDASSGTQLLLTEEGLARLPIAEQPWSEPVPRYL